MIQLTQLAKASISGSSMTLCRCWTLIRKDGKSLYFTDHDEVLVVNNKHHSPINSFQSSAGIKSAGTQLRDKQIKGVLASDLMTEEDFLAGLYRDAVITEFMFDWMRPEVGPFLQETYWIANTEWNGLSWQANIESLTAWLQLMAGRNYMRDCRHDLGDSVCRVNRASFKRAGTVGSILSEFTKFNTDLSGEFYPDAFNDGEIEFTSGQNSGFISQIKGFSGVTGQIILWLEPIKPVTTGDTFYIYPGCSKQRQMCFEAYNNIINYGGFPDLVGNDRMVRTPDIKS